MVISPRKKYGIILLCALCIRSLFAQTDERKNIALIPERFVELPALSSYDPLFQQYIHEVEQNYIRMSRGNEPIINFYRYTIKKDDELFAVAARCSIPYETITTLNALTSPVDFAAGKTLLLPTAAGIFVYEHPKNSLEILIANNDSAIAKRVKLWYTMKTRSCFFLANVRLSSTERAYFLDTSLRMPLDNYRLSSAYGMRISPISGTWRFHRGIDLAAPEGTPVYACKGGKVILAATGDPQFGNHVILQHDGGMTSVYAHLSKIHVSKGQEVSTGKELGLVGKTGAATGPHLHFEIRVNGVSTDPARLLSR